MASPKFVEIEGKRFLWRELLQRRRDQAYGGGQERTACFVRGSRMIAGRRLRATPPDATASPACSA